MTAQRRANRKDTDPATEYAVRAYREFGHMLEQLAKDEKAAGRPLHARHRAQKAFLAFRAERAELIDPEPKLAPVMVCCPQCVLYRARDAE
jgi:hypothetical protein